MDKELELNTFKVAIVIHAFYAEQFQIMADRINAVCDIDIADIEVDVHITLNDSSEPEIHTIIATDLSQAKVHYQPNYGMDLLPFFRLVPSLQAYDWVLKLHTKSCDNQASCIWFESLYEGLIGTPEVFFKTLECIRANPSWTMAGIMPFFMSAQHLMLNNQSNVEKVAKLWQVDIDDDWGFFAGSLYWIKPRHFADAAHDLIEKEEWFEQPFAKDGQIAHAIERLVTKVAQKSGDIGLFLPSQLKSNYSFLVYSSKHPFAINKVSTQQLMHSYQHLIDNFRILQRVSLLDVLAYSKDVGVNFECNSHAYLHFLLIGQFNGFANRVRPLELKQLEYKMMNWPMLRQQPRQKELVSIIIPVLNNIKLTLACLASIRKYTQNINYEVIIIDNGSKKFNGFILDMYASLSSKVHIVHLPRNLNFSVACNYGFSKSQGDKVVFLNNDTQVTANWLRYLQEAITNPEVIAVQPKLLYFDDKVQCAGVYFGEDGFGRCRFEGDNKDSSEANTSTVCEALTAACLMITSHDFATLEGFDAWYINGQEDMDLCLRIRQKHTEKYLWYEAKSTVYHHRSKTKGRKSHINQNREIFKAKWHNQSSVLQSGAPK